MTTHLYSPIITSADFTQQVHLGYTPETTTLEFKKDLDRWRNRPEKERKDAQKEFCRDISQFANSYGGCLLLGVEERLVNGQRIAGSVHSLDSIDDRRGWMEQAVHNYLTPSPPLFIHGITTADGSSIISVNVPPSERLVAVWDKDHGTVECLRRTNHGKVRMNLQDIESFLMHTTRASMLAFLRVHKSVQNKLVDLVSGIWEYRRLIPAQPLALQRISRPVILNEAGEHEFELSIQVEQKKQNLKMKIPYGLVREVWLTSGLQMGLFLHARVVIDDHLQIGMEPF